MASRKALALDAVKTATINNAATTSVVASYTLPANGLWIVEAVFLFRNLTDATYSTVTKRTLFHRASGTTTEVAGAAQDLLVLAGTFLTALPGLDNSGDLVRASFTGILLKNIECTVHLSVGSGDLADGVAL